MDVNVALRPGDDSGVALGKRSNVVHRVRGILSVDLSIFEQKSRDIHPNGISPVDAGEQWDEITTEGSIASGSSTGEQDDWGFLAVGEGRWDVNGSAKLGLRDGIRGIAV